MRLGFVALFTLFSQYDMSVVAFAFRMRFNVAVVRDCLVYNAPLCRTHGLEVHCFACFTNPLHPVFGLYDESIVALTFIVGNVDIDPC